MEKIKLSIFNLLEGLSDQQKHQMLAEIAQWCQHKASIIEHKQGEFVEVVE